MVSLHSQHIAPKLDPVSDPKFFGPNLEDGKRVKGEYSTDGRPGVDDHFGYPFPAMQDTRDYDKDFVKDDNDDDGEWKANNRYDAIRVKLGKAKAEAEKAERDVAREQEELAESKEAEETKEAQAEEYGRAAEDARAAKAAAERKSQVANQTIEEAERLVAREVGTFEDCKQQLAKARQHLEALMAEKDSREAEKAQAGADEVAAERDDEILERRVARERAGYDSANGEAKVTAEDVKKTEAELEAAAKKLRRFRRSDNGLDQDGGVYGGYRSSAATPAFAAFLLGLMQLLVVL